MAHALYTPKQAAVSTIAALRYLSTANRLVRQDFSSEFVAGKGQTVDVKGPITLAEARVYTKTNRANRDAIQFDELAQTYYPVKMEDQVYSAVRLPDDFATFTLESLEQQVLKPQAEVVVQGLMKPLITTMQQIAPAPVAQIPLVLPDGSNFRAVLIKLRAKLNKRKVPLAGRSVLVGPGLEAAALSDPQLQKVNESGSDGVLRDAAIGRLFGFDIFAEQQFPDYYGVAFNEDAFAHVTRPSAPPAGAAKAAVASQDGLSLRYLQHYNPSQLEDQSVVDAFVGARILDPERAISFGGKLVGASIVMTPDTASVAVGQTLQLSVVDADGGVVPNRLVTFTAGTGRVTIDGNGLLTAVTAGAATTVTATFDGASDTSAITTT